MKGNWIPAAVILFALALSPMAWGQADEPASAAGEPPRLLLLVHQEIKFGKARERQKLEVAMSRACDHLNVPNSWIDLQSLTGPRETLSFDPFDSYEDLEKAIAGWGRLFAAHPELARMQEEIEVLVSSERTLIAVRRDDLGYRAKSIDFSKARFMRVLEVRLHPGYENEFVEAFKSLSDAHEKIKADTPWVIYQVNIGMPSPAFLILVPMRALEQNDDLLNWRKYLRDAEGEDAARRMEQNARNGYVSTESNLYVISPEMSHVSKEFAEGDPEFWLPKRPAAPSPTARKDAESKRKQ